jgi:DNA invertase Pin-like site-specific DNA recombinase
MNTQNIGKISDQITFTEETVKYVLYARKSTESDELQAMSIDSQIKEMLQLAEREKLLIVDVKKEAHSAKASGQRPVFKEILEDLRTGKYTGILTWAPDRLSRNAGDLGSLVDLMDQKKLVHIQTFSQKFTNDPSQKFLLMILCSQAKLENDNKSINVKRGLRAKVELGLWPSPAPTGYITSDDKKQSGVVLPDPERSNTIRELFEHIGYDNWSGFKAYEWLDKEKKFKTIKDKHLSKGNFYLLLKNTFYYGHFEYPFKSGNWYKGAHTPLITKELFDLVQSNISGNYQDSGPKQREFALTKLLTCGECGSGITAEEKFKNLVAGGRSRHIYYKCTRSKNRTCLVRMNEKDLILKLNDIIDKIDLNKLALKERIQKEVTRFKRFQSKLLQNQNQITLKEIDIREYVKFILEEGELEEKREVLNCLKGNLKLTTSNLVLS